jgi:SPX domain protein involved in polyphosphate accumulation
MKFGKHLQKERESDWAVHYIDYNELKKLIMRIGEEKAGVLIVIKPGVRQCPRGISRNTHSRYKKNAHTRFHLIDYVLRI